jgi:hypothetical protein
MYIKKFQILLEKWLYKKRSNKEIFKVVFIFFFSFQILIYSLSLLTEIFQGDGLGFFTSDDNLIFNFDLFVTLPFFFFLLALREEIFFRLPIALFLHKKVSFHLKLILILILQVLFTLVHYSGNDNLWFTFVPVFISGVIFSIIFVISGGNEKKYIKALIIVTLYHTLQNIFVGLPKIIYGILSNLLT